MVGTSNTAAVQDGQHMKGVDIAPSHKGRSESRYSRCPRQGQRLQKLLLLAGSNYAVPPLTELQRPQLGQVGGGDPSASDTGDDTPQPPSTHARVRDVDRGHLTARERLQLTEVVSNSCDLGLFPTGPKLVLPCKRG